MLTSVLSRVGDVGASDVGVEVVVFVGGPVVVLGIRCILGSRGLYCGPRGFAWARGSMGVALSHRGWPGGYIPDFMRIIVRFE